MIPRDKATVPGALRPHAYVEPPIAPPVGRGAGRKLLALALAGLLAVFIWHGRDQLGEAVTQLRSARPLWLLGAFGAVAVGYLLSSQVFGVVLRVMGQRVGTARLWLMAVTAIVITQCAPAGAVGGYAFILTALRRRRIPAAQAAVLATLEALSYVGAMLLLSVFGVLYLVMRQGGGHLALMGPGLAVGGVALTLAGVVWGLSRPVVQLRRMLLGFANRLPRRMRRATLRKGMAALSELATSRALVLDRPGLVVALVGLQTIALLGHSLALLCVLHSLGAPLGLGAAVAAFGAALMTSTFNLLPGGGGTVEAVLAGVLLYVAAGPAAVPAAILFRLLNFWALLPVATAGYFWLLREPRREPGCG